MVAAGTCLEHCLRAKPTSTNTLSHAMCRWEDGEYVVQRLDGVDRWAVHASDVVHVAAGGVHIAVHQRVRLQPNPKRLDTAPILLCAEAPKRATSSNIVARVAHLSEQAPRCAGAGEGAPRGRDVSGCGDVGRRVRHARPPRCDRRLISSQCIPPQWDPLCACIGNTVSVTSRT